MKTRFPSILGIFIAILMVASFVIPVSIAAPAAASANPGIVKWDAIVTAPIVGINIAGPPIITESLTKAFWPKNTIYDTVLTGASPSPPIHTIVTFDGLAQTGINISSGVYPTAITQAGKGYNTNGLLAGYINFNSGKSDILPVATSGNTADRASPAFVMIGISRWVIIDGSRPDFGLLVRQLGQPTYSLSSKPASAGVRAGVSNSPLEFAATLAKDTGIADLV